MVDKTVKNTETASGTAATKAVDAMRIRGGYFSGKKLWALLAAGGLVLVIGGLLVIRSQAVAGLNPDQERLSRALTVRAVPVRASASYQVQQNYSGKIVAGRESDHGFDHGGLLAEVLVDEGARVRKGDILARLDMRRLEARGRELKADLDRAVALNHEAAARLDQARANFDRYRVLRDKKHISTQKFEQVKFDLAALTAHKAATESAVLRARAALKSLETDRELATLAARFDGSVVRRYRDEGAALGAGAPVLRLIEDSKLEIHVGLPQTAALALTPGAAVGFDYQGRRIGAKLRTMLAEVDDATRTVTAIFDITSDSHAIRPGGLARLAVTREIQQAGFWLPSSALAESRRGLWSVYSLADHDGAPDYGALARQELQVLHMESDRVFVRGTLRDGDRVVTDGIHRLVPGQLVRLSRDN